MIQIALIVYIILVITFSIISSGAGAGISYSDKIVHLMAYGAMGLLAYLSAHSFNKKVYLFLIVVGLGLALEFVQYFLPARSASFTDFAANFLGAVMGYLFGWMVLKSELRKLLPKKN